MTDIRQSPYFCAFMEDLGWQVELLGKKHYVFLRKFPLLGYFAKSPRPQAPYEIDKICAWIKKRHIFRFHIAPHITKQQKNFRSIRKEFLAHGFRINQSPFNPTTTIYIDLQGSESDIFSRFSSAKRRGVRRAQKHGVIVTPSTDIDAFIHIRAQQYAPFGFLVKKETRLLWNHFAPHHGMLLLAHHEDTPACAGIFLLFYQKKAYYWFASATADGKKYFAPTLLVWEALRFAKKHGCTVFDFEGIYDDRFPKAAKTWKGFTKFKEGFGGETVQFLENFFA